MRICRVIGKLNLVTYVLPYVNDFRISIGLDPRYKMVDENWKNVAKLLTGLDESEQGLIANVLKRDLDVEKR